MRLAVVDDEITIRFSLKKYFELRSCTVDVADTIPAARQLLSTVVFDVVILDIHLVPGPDVEGLELIGTVRQYSPQARIVVLSCYLSSQTVERARDLGADLILQTPQPLHELAAAIHPIA